MRNCPGHLFLPDGFILLPVRFFLPLTTAAVAQSTEFARESATYRNGGLPAQDEAIEASQEVLEFAGIGDFAQRP